MKKTFYWTAFLLIIFCNAFAQGDPPAVPPNILGLKMSFITKQLALTNDESQKFWPVYYSYTAEIRKIRQAKKDDVLSFEEDILNVRKKYKTEFKKILNTDERVNKALTADRDFMTVVRKELQQRQSRGKKKDIN